MKLVIPTHVYQKIMFWVNRADFEVSGFGKVQHSNGVLTVLDAILLKQEGTGAHTEIDPAALGKAMFELKDTPGDLNFWWHSHVKMPAFWSSQDTETIESIGANGYCVATVFNQKNEHKSAFCGAFTNPFGESQVVRYDDITTQIGEGLDESLVKTWEEQFKSHVQEKKYSGALWSEDLLGYNNATKKYAVESEHDRTLGCWWERGNIFQLTPSDADKIESYMESDAKMLGMTPAALRRVLVHGTEKQIQKIETKLDALYAQKGNSRALTSRVN